MHADRPATSAEELATRLELHQLGSIEEAPPTLSFERSRKIELPWTRLAEFVGVSEADAEATAADHLRTEFEQSWGYDEVGEDEAQEILSRGLLLSAVWQDPDDTTNAVAAWLPEDEHSGFATLDGDVLDADEVVARHGSGRDYRLVMDPPSTVADFRGAAGYRSSWRNVRSIELVVPHVEPVLEDPAPADDPPEDAPPGDNLTTETEQVEPPGPDDALVQIEGASTDTSIEEPALIGPPTTEQPDEADPAGQMVVHRIDLRAPFIEARYGELSVLRGIADKKSVQADRIFTEAAAQATTPGQLDDLEGPVVATALALDRIDRALERLARQASQMGYYLHLETSENPPPLLDSRNPEGAAIKPGVLYERVPVRHTVIPTRVVSTYLTFLGLRSHALIGRWTRSSTATTYRRVDTGRSPHLDYIARMQAEGRIVHVCELRHNGYVTNNGAPLELIMLQCEQDEELRRATVVLIPDYDERLSGERVITGYTAYEQPIPGTAATSFPELEVVENLSYKTTWLRTEVGELVQSINLAPGERREITVSRSFERTTTESTATSSVFDLASTSSNDLSSEMERTLRNESDVSDSMSASATVRGGTAFVSGEATASASRDKSVKQVGTDMAKAAQRAARSLSEQRREEVSSSRTSTTTIARSDVSVSTIENINEGRTLNLMFHRLHNRYVGRLFLDDLKLRVRSGIELITGSGIRSQRVFSVRELREMIAELASTPLPIALDDEQQAEFELALLQATAGLVLGEYQELGEATDGDSTGEFAISFGDDAADVFDTVRSVNTLEGDRDGDDAAEQFDALSKRIGAVFESMRFSGQAVNRTELLVSSEGLYLDAQVGMRPSTEPYSELRREAEVAMRYAEVEQVRADALRTRSIAHRVGPSTTAIGVAQIILIDSTLHVVPAQPLGGGLWGLRHGDDPVPGTTSWLNASTLIHEFGTNPIPEWARVGDAGAVSLAVAIDLPNGLVANPA